MAFTTNDFRGEIHDPINVTNADGVDIYASLRDYLFSLAGSTSVPMSLREDTLKSGGFLFGSRMADPYQPSGSVMQVLFNRYIYK